MCIRDRSEDQIQYMLAHGIPVDRIDSTVLYDEQLAVCKRIEGEGSGLKALYTTPETLQHNRHLARALQVAQAGDRINFITIDGAHCVLEWLEFRRDCSHAIRVQRPTAQPHSSDQNSSSR